MIRRLLANTRPRSSIGARSNNSSSSSPGITLNAYHEASDSKLDELSERLEAVLEDRYDHGADVSLNNGVLTVVVDKQNTYVINKQTPNRQLWLSSPVSGPMRFDLQEGKWVEKHSRIELSSLLSKELSQLLNESVNI